MAAGRDLCRRAWTSCTRCTRCCMPARGAAQVVTIHDLYFLDHAGEHRGRDSPRLRRARRAHARRADAVIDDFGVHRRPDPVAVRRAADDRVTICPPGAPRLAAQDRRPRAGGQILFMGTIEPRKNVGDAASTPMPSCSARRPMRRRSCSPGRIDARLPALLARLHAAAARRPRPHLGYVSDDERERLYRAASMLVLPSLDEGFGMPALEAMTIGVPVVVSHAARCRKSSGDAGAARRARRRGGAGRRRWTAS